MEKFLVQQGDQINEGRVETLLDGKHKKIYVIAPSSDYIDDQFENKKSLEIVDSNSFRKPEGFSYERFDLISESSLRVLKNIKVSDMLEEGKSFIDVCPEAYPKELVAEEKNDTTLENLTEDLILGARIAVAADELRGSERRELEDQIREHDDNLDRKMKEWAADKFVSKMTQSTKGIARRLEEAKENGYTTVLFSDGKFDEGVLDALKIEGLLDYTV